MIAAGPTTSQEPTPTLPGYSGANVRGIVPALLAPKGAPRPAWIPAPARHAPQVVLLVLDGLGWEQLQARRSHAVCMASMAGGPITTVAPSTTATALTSITTGLTPGEHGIVGYRFHTGGDVLNVLRWHVPTGDARRLHEPKVLQPFDPFLGFDVPVVGRAELDHSAFTEAHMRGARLHGWRTPSNLAVTVGQLLRTGERFVYAYYDGIDKVAHRHGFGPYYDAELRAADRLVADVVEQLPPGAALLVTADHGQVHVGDELRPVDPVVRRLCRGSSGEGRFRWLHARPGVAGDLLAAARQLHGGDAWVRSRDEVVAAGWLGPIVSPPVASRLGDVALVAHAPVSFDDPADTGSSPLVCRHGSLTASEMVVPLLAAGAD